MRYVRIAFDALKLDDTFSDRGMFFNLFKYSTNYSLSFLFANGKVLGRDIC